MRDFIVGVLRFLVPPDQPEDAMKVHRWRWSVAIFIWVLLAVVGLYIGADQGLIHGVQGRVTHTELNSLREEVHKTDGDTVNALTRVLTRLDTQDGELKLITASSLAESIRSKLTSWCMTHDANFKRELRQEIDDPMQGLEKKYFDLTGQGYRQPGCDEL